MIGPGKSAGYLARLPEPVESVSPGQLFLKIRVIWVLGVPRPVGLGCAGRGFCRGGGNGIRYILSGMVLRCLSSTGVRFDSGAKMGCREVGTPLQVRILPPALITVL